MIHLGKIQIKQKIKKTELSDWGTCEVTITPQVLEELKEGKILFISVFDEYSVLIKVADEISYEEK